MSKNIEFTLDCCVPDMVRGKNDKFHQKIKASPLWSKFEGFRSFGDGTKDIYILEDGTIKYYAPCVLVDEHGDDYYYYPFVETIGG